MATRNLTVVLSGRVTSLRQAMRAGSAEVKQFSQDVNRVSQDTKVHTDRIGRYFLAAGAIIVAAFLGSVVAATRFEAEMRNVTTISSYVEKNFASTSQRLIELSNTLPQSASELARGLYDVASSGFAGAEGVRVLEVSAKAASAGLSTTATAGRAITGVLNAYGMSAGNARDVSDILFQTVNLGVITFEELAQNIGDVVGVSASAKIPIKDIGTAIATITLSGIPAAEATTALNRTIQALIQPSEELQDLLLKLGYESGSAALEQDGLQKVMTRVRAEVGGNTSAFLALFPEIRAARGALALTAAEGANYARVAREMDGATKGVGATQRALEKQQQALAFQIGVVKNQVVNTGIVFGTAFLPVLKFTASVLSTVVQGFQSMPGPMRTVLIVIGLLLAVTLLLGGAFIVLAPRIVATKVALAALGTSANVAKTGMLAASVGLSVLSVGLIVFSAIAGGAAKRQGEINARAQEYGDILRKNAGYLDESYDAQLKHNLAQVDAIAIANKAGIETNDLIGLIRQRNLTEAEGMRLAAGLKKIREGDGDAALQFFMALEKETAARKRAIDLYEQETGKKKLNTKETIAAQEAAEREKDTLRSLGQQMEENGSSTTALTKAQQALGSTYRDALSPVDAYRRALDRTQQTNDRFSSVGANAFRTFSDKGSTALRDFISILNTQATDTAKWQANLVIVAQRGGDAFAAELAKLGPEAAGLIAQIAVAAQPEFDKLKEVFTAAAKGTMESFTAELEAQNARVVAWQTNLIAIAARGGAAFAQQLASLGPDAADLVAEIVTASQPEFDRTKTAFAKNAELASDATAREFDLGLQIAAQTAGTGATKIAEQIAKKLSLGMDEVLRIAKRYSIGLGAVLAGGSTPPPFDLNFSPSDSGPSPSTSWTPPDGYADGGIKFFARGGEDHSAQIVRPGAWRVFGEPETGGEAYIPLSMAKRLGSMRVLRTVAGRFGYQVIPRATRFAATGLLNPVTALKFGGGAPRHVEYGRASGAWGGPNVTVHSQVVVEGHVYGDADLDRKMNRALDKRDRELAISLRRTRGA